MAQARRPYRWMWLVFAVVVVVGLPTLVIRMLMLSGVIDTLSVRLVMPAEGAVVYANTLTVRGTTEGIASAVVVEVVPVVPSATFAGYTDLAPLTVDGRFAVQFVPTYDGPPVEMLARVYAVNDTARSAPKAETRFTLAALADRPTGEYVDVLTPLEGVEVGGDLIEVSGRASGVAGGTLTVALIDSAGTTLDTVTLDLPTDNLLDDVPWAAALRPDGVTGSALVRISGADGVVYWTIPVVLSSAAG